MQRVVDRKKKVREQVSWSKRVGGKRSIGSSLTATLLLSSLSLDDAFATFHHLS